MESSDATTLILSKQIMVDGAHVNVLPAVPVNHLYEYIVPRDFNFEIGSLVRIPLRNRITTGVIWENSNKKLPIGKVKAVESILKLPSIKEDLRDLVDWVASYTLAERGSILRMILNSSALSNTNKTQKFYNLTTTKPQKMTKAREQVIRALSNGIPKTFSEIHDITKVSNSVVKGLEKIGCLEAVIRPESMQFRTHNAYLKKQNLSVLQSKAAKQLIKLVEQDSFSVTLLEGVTGSGKTEVYFEALSASILAGKQALVLLPEIALSTQWLSRFEDRFGVEPAVWHSEITPKYRGATWQATAEGNVSIVVGARSALWLPFKNLGLIIVDEEHDPGYKQEEGVIYHARDMAVARGKMENLPVVLASATPSLETLKNVENKRYNHCFIPSRFGAAKLPKIEAIDMRKQSLKKNCWLSEPLQLAVKNTLDRKHQAALFLNRRGYAPLTLCKACGYCIECPNCSTWLVEHRVKNTLNCHHCGYSETRQNQCKNCGETGTLKPCGPGVERLAEEVETLYPSASIEIATSDTMVSPKIAEKILKRIESCEVDIVIGTQVIAKGYNFPMLTLIGVVDADLGLAGADLRAAEHTYHLLNQVSGRAGRSEHEGNVMLQTYMPEHPVMKGLIDGKRSAFLKEEAAARAKNFLPPYGRLIAIIFSGEDEQKVIKTAKLLTSIARSNTKNIPDISILGPAPASLSILRGKYRYRILIKGKDSQRLQPPLKTWLKKIGNTDGVRIQIDVDPHSFL